MKRQIPRENVYVCIYGCHTVTVDVDKGTTPFVIKCRSKSTPDRPLIPELTGDDGECIGYAESCFYPKVPRPPHIRPPTHEWYKPTDLSGLSESDKDHVSRGGLLLRERTDAKPIYHD